MDGVQNVNGSTPWSCSTPSLLRVRMGTATVVIVQGPPRLYQMHWDPSIARTMPCISVGCVRCSEGIARRPMAYVPVLRMGVVDGGTTWRRAVLELPVRAGMQLASLSGRGVSLCRRKPRGPVEVQSVRLRTAPDYAEDWDIGPGLAAMWRIGRTVSPTIVDMSML